MTYTDYFAVESRGLYSPPNGARPQVLPDYWREKPKETPRTDLPELSDEELNALGWKGPIEDVDVDFYTHKKIWNEQTREWNVLELEQSEKEKKVDYRKFWTDLIDSSVYFKIKETASQSLVANTIITEFIALLTDAKNGYANIAQIQLKLLEIIENISFTSKEFEEIQTIFKNSGMHSIYTLS